MIVVDANLLLYAYDESSGMHLRGRKWWESTLSSAPQVGIPWLTTMAFLRIITNSRAVSRPVSADVAVATVRQWYARSNVYPIQEGPRHLEILAKLIEEGQVRGPLMMDAHLAALTVERAATLATHDKDFRRFPSLNVTFPLDSPPMSQEP